MSNYWYDYIIVGSGMFGAAFAFQARKQTPRVLVIEKSEHIGGACYTEEKNGVMIHKYGPHIFHTNDKSIWEWVNQFGEFKSFINQPIAKYGDKIYNLPFNMNTFYQLYGIILPEEAQEAIKKDCIDFPGSSVESCGYRKFGKKIYETLIKDYTEKQWGRSCKDLPQSLIERILLRFEFNNNYFSDQFQGVPVKGYTYLISEMLKDIPVILNKTYAEFKEDFPYIGAGKVIYTGAIDEYYNYCFGKLDYRSLLWDEKIAEQGCAVVNYTSKENPYTRSIEHKWFMGSSDLPAYTSFEKPVEWEPGLERYYPVNTEENLKLYNKYKAYAKERDPNVIFCGRIGGYEYINMDTAISKAISLEEELAANNKI